MTERLGPAGVLAMGSQGSKPSAWVFLFFIWKIRQKNSLYFPGLSWKQKDIMCTQPLVQNAYHHSQQEEAAKILTLGQLEIQNFFDFSKLGSQIQDDETIQDIDFFSICSSSEALCGDGGTLHTPTHQSYPSLRPCIHHTLGSLLRSPYPDHSCPRPFRADLAAYTLCLTSGPPQGPTNTSNFLSQLSTAW